jgi:putative membrane protein
MTRRELSSHEPLILLAAAGIVLVWSCIQPFERGTWRLEVAPVLIGAPLLVATFSRFRLSPLLYRLVARKR